MDRKAELEKKRKRLEELRRAREATQAAATVPAATLATQTRAAAGTPTEQDVTNLVSSLLGEGSTAASGRATPQSPDRPLTPATAPSSPPPTPKPDVELGASRPVARQLTLTTTAATHVSVEPQPPVITYEKGAQTDDRLWEALVEERIVQQVKGAEKDAQTQAVGTQIDDEGPRLPDKTAEESKPKDEIILDEERAAALMQSEAFQAFFERSTRIVERALNQPYDFAIDYSAGEDERTGSSGREIVQIWSCKNEKLTRGRAVTSVDWSPRFPELFATAYSKNESILDEAHGRVVVWNSHLQDRPEFVFTCQSAVTAVKFASFHSHLILGGTYSGQIVLWDTRAKSTPVQRTMLSPQSHTYPVYSMDVIGTQNAHNVISASTDGRICSWTVDLLSEPHDTVDLQIGTRKLAIMSMSFPENDANNFVVGGEDSNVYVCTRHGSSRGVTETLSGHYGPTTAVHLHPSRGEVDFSDYILSSSVDWSIKLWSKSGNRLIYSFEEASDYIYDVQWSPTHPAVFASVDGQSRLCLWNLNEDTEIPVMTTKVSERGSALNHVRWSADGRRLLVGDLDGRSYVYEVGESFATPRADDWSRLRDVLHDMSVFSNVEASR